MKKSLKRTAALILALLMTAALCACEKKPGPDDPQDPYEGLEKMRLEHVYSMKYLDTDVEEQPEPSPTPESSENYYEYSDEYIRNISEANGKIYISCEYYNEKYENEEYVYDNGVRVYTMNPDGSDYTLIDDFKADLEQGENFYRYSSITNINYCPDGSYWCCMDTGYDDWSDINEYKYEYTTILKHVAADGTELASVDTKELSTNSDYNDFYIDKMLITNDGGLIINSSQKIYVFDSELNIVSTVEFENSWIDSLSLTGSGDLVALVYDNNSGDRKFQRLNMDSGTFDDVLSPPSDAWDIRGGAGTTVLYGIDSGSASIYSFDYITGEQKEILNWINSDINPSRINNVTPISNGNFLVTEYDRDYSKRRLALLSPVADGDIVEKYIIDFAAIYLDNNLQNAIIDFNKQNDLFRIRYLDYSVYNTDDDYSGGTKQLNLDIISGKIPDIISLSELPFTTYASKGLLADLGALMDADESFVRDDYLTNILDAPNYNGKIFSIIPMYEIMTTVGKSDIVGEEMGWTIEDLQQLLEQRPGSTPFGNTVDRNSMLYYFSSMALGKYIDYNTGTCKFNSDDFIKMLEFINSFPESIDWDSIYNDYDYWNRLQSEYSDGTTLLQTYWLYNYDSIKSAMNDFGGEITFIGYPVPQGIGSVINPTMELAISSKTKLTDACWDFFKYLLSDDFQSSGYGLMVKRSTLDKLAEEAMDASRYSSFTEYGYSVDMPVSTMAPMEPDFWNKPLTQEQVDKVNEAIASATTVYRNENTIVSIIEEEAGAFFAGQKDVRTVADIIQSRVQIYINENR